MNNQVLILAKMFFILSNGGMITMNEAMGRFNISRSTFFRVIALLKIVLAETGMVEFEIQLFNGYYILTKNNARCFVEFKNWSLKK